MSTTKIKITNKTNANPVNVVLFQINKMNSSTAIVWEVAKGLAKGASHVFKYDNYPLLQVVSPSKAVLPVRQIANGGRFQIDNKNGAIFLTEIYENVLSRSSKTQVFNNLQKGTTSASILMSKFPIMTMPFIPPLQGATFQLDNNIYAFIDTTKKLKKGSALSFEEMRSARFYPIIDTISVAIDV